MNACVITAQHSDVRAWTLFSTALVSVEKRYGSAVSSGGSCGGSPLPSRMFYHEVIIWRAGISV